MILADTSVWVDYLRFGIREMREHLEQNEIVSHPLIAAELALGSLRDRQGTLALFDLLPQVRVARLSEVRLLIKTRHLYGIGIGITDAQLIASILIHPPTVLWTRDKALRRAAERLGLHANLS